MKKIRALIAFACALVATLSLAVPAFAAGDGPYTLTIRSETPGHTYEAYRVFAGDVGTDGETLSNVSWGEGVDKDGLLADLQGSQDFGTSNPFANCDSAAGVAAVLSGKDAAFADSFAEVVGARLVAGKAISLSAGSQDGNEYVYTATGLKAGYYLVQDKAGSPSDSQYAKTKFILAVVANVTAEAKADHPTLDKTIFSVEGEEVNLDYANAAVGDTVTFQLTSRVPEMDGYNKYLFAVTDTLAEGFTLDGNFGADDVTVKIGDTKLPTSDYTVSASGNVITIELTNLLAQRKNADNSINITYSATVNNKAEIGDGGNTNTAYLQFSNDPNHEYANLETDAKYLGKTPNATAYVYVGGLVIHKVDEGNAPIAGAQFQISSEDFNQVIVVGAEFVEDQDAGTYYKLKNGSYTTVRPPSGDNTSDYESATPYALKTTTKTETPAGDPASVTSWVDAQGKLVVAGLSAGTYTITELTAPDGYNKAGAVEVELGWDAPSATGPTTCTWKKDGESATLEPVNDMGLVSVTIQNFRGATLPSTGGIGKTVLITAGAVLVLVAGVGLVTKFRAHRMK